jgi:hypothetical protein
MTPDPPEQHHAAKALGAPFEPKRGAVRQDRDRG